MIATTRTILFSPLRRRTTSSHDELRRTPILNEIRRRMFFSGTTKRHAILPRFRLCGVHQPHNTTTNNGSVVRKLLPLSEQHGKPFTTSRSTTTQQPPPLAAAIKKTNKVEEVGTTEKSSMLQRWFAPKEIPPRGTLRWYGEMVLLCTVFAITGTATMVLVRPAVSEGLGLHGTLKDGPWSYRICSIVIMTPLYSAMLVVVGTIFGRHAYFRHFSVKMFSRFGIPPELMDKNFHRTAKNFRKW